MSRGKRNHWDFDYGVACNQWREPVSAEDALLRLMRGNNRYVVERFAAKDIGQDRRKELAKGQHPFAVIVGCSDSRVPPEMIFDQGLGDLFVVRTAGEVVDVVALGSVEYAAIHLNVRLIVVLGHEECGAVKAAVEGSREPGHIAVIVEAIQPAVDQARYQEGDLLTNAINNNIDLNVRRLMSSSILRDASRNQGLNIIGALYNMQSGNVDFKYSAIQYSF